MIQLNLLKLSYRIAEAKVQVKLNTKIRLLQNHVVLIGFISVRAVFIL